MEYLKRVKEEFAGYEDILRNIGTACRDRHWTVASAESCTSGRIASHLGQLPGSSDFFRGGVVSYATDVKSMCLGVNKDTIDRYDVVSEEVAKEMAAGVAKLMETDFALATTGYAGPGGGTDTIPVGTVCFGYKTPRGVITEKLLFPRTMDREQIVEAATQHAVQTLQLILIKTMADDNKVAAISTKTCDVPDYDMVTGLGYD